MTRQTTPRFRVLLTDYAWAELDVERSVLSEIGAELVVADEQDEAALIELARDVDAIMTCWANTTSRVIRAAANCQIVSRLGIGLDNIDVEFCTERGIPVTNVPDYCATEVAEHTLALIFALARNIAIFHTATKRGNYDLQEAPTPRRIEGQTLGIVGLGNIGRTVAEKASAIGMRVLACRRSKSERAANATIVAFDELLRESDFVSLHLPLTSETHGLVDSEALDAMRSTSFLINTARGGLVDHVALAEALDGNQIAGAGLDVQQPEPPDLSLPPFNDPRVIVTPHAAFVSVESVEELRRRAARQVVARLTGTIPENVVNPIVLS
ncbi:MAG: C-terminal binding protein [Planctomycetes bacterium]|nr:C-terminal binding protein [Planctomycetota bacterium]